MLCASYPSGSSWTLCQKMPHFVDYPNDQFSEDKEASLEFAELISRSGTKIGKYFKIAAVIFWSPWVLSIFGIVHLPSSVFFFSVGGGFALIILRMIQSGREATSLFETCRRCQGPLRKESHRQRDFFVCDKCQTFIRGGDFS